MKAEGDKI